MGGNTSYISHSIVTFLALWKSSSLMSFMNMSVRFRGNES